MCFFIGKGNNNELFSKCASQSKKESADDKDKYQNFETMSLIIHLYHIVVRRLELPMKSPPKKTYQYKLTQKDPQYY